MDYTRQGLKEGVLLGVGWSFIVENVLLHKEMSSFIYGPLSVFEDVWKYFHEFFDH